jgi:hypothetical protein
MWHIRPCRVGLCWGFLPRTSSGVIDIGPYGSEMLLHSSDLLRYSMLVQIRAIRVSVLQEEFRRVSSILCRKNSVGFHPISAGRIQWI